MRGPDGTEYPNHVTYRVIDPPNHISYTQIEPKFESNIVFESIGERTRVTLVMTFETSELRDFVARKHGAEAGLKQTLSTARRARRSDGGGSRELRTRNGRDARVRCATRTRVQGEHGSRDDDAVVGAAPHQRISRARSTYASVASGALSKTLSASSTTSAENISRSIRHLDLS